MTAPITAQLTSLSPPPSISVVVRAEVLGCGVVGVLLISDGGVVVVDSGEVIEIVVVDVRSFVDTDDDSTVVNVGDVGDVGDAVESNGGVTVDVLVGARDVARLGRVVVVVVRLVVRRVVGVVVVVDGNDVGASVVVVGNGVIGVGAGVGAQVRPGETGEQTHDTPQFGDAVISYQQHRDKKCQNKSKNAKTKTIDIRCSSARQLLHHDEK